MACGPPSKCKFTKILHSAWTKKRGERQRLRGHAGTALFITQNAGPDYQEAGIWNDTPGSWQSLQPAAATNSQANDTHFGQQAGWAYLPNAQNPALPTVQHAALWYSSAASFVDL